MLCEKDIFVILIMVNNNNYSSQFKVVVSDYKGKHIRCFAHSLQLVVRDGLVESKAINLTLAKCSKIASTLHTSTKFKVGRYYN